MKRNIILRVTELVVMGGILAAWISLIPHPHQTTTSRSELRT